VPLRNKGAQAGKSVPVHTPELTWSEVYKKLLKRREWRLGWAERADMGFSLPERKDPRNAQAAQLIEFARLGKLFLSGLTH
jgi:hypothetical protein